MRHSENNWAVSLIRQQRGGNVKTYVGVRKNARAIVTVDVNNRTRQLRHIPYHSPDGFEWGYGGSGPADLALNILGLFVAPPEAWRWHQHYKGDVLCHLDRH